MCPLPPLPIVSQGECSFFFSPQAVIWRRLGHAHPGWHHSRSPALQGSPPEGPLLVPPPQGSVIICLLELFLFSYRLAPWAEENGREPVLLPLCVSSPARRLNEVSFPLQRQFLTLALWLLRFGFDTLPPPHFLKPPQQSISWVNCASWKVSLFFPAPPRPPAYTLPLNSPCSFR